MNKQTWQIHVDKTVVVKVMVVVMVVVMVRVRVQVILVTGVIEA